MFWIQSGISSNVNPNFHRGAQKVSKSSITYKTLSTIDFPTEFTGKEAVTTTLKSLDTCHSGAEALPGMLSGIGRGMSLKDMESYARLLNRFNSTQQSLIKIDVGSTIFQGTGYNPTDEEIQAIMSNPMPNGEEWHAASEYYQDPYAGQTIDQANGEFTPASTQKWGTPFDFLAGVVGGGLSYVDETANGFISAVASIGGGVSGFVGAIKSGAGWKSAFDQASLEATRAGAKYCNVFNLTSAYEGKMRDIRNRSK